MLLKFEQNCTLRKIQNFALFCQKLVTHLSTSFVNYNDSSVTMDRGILTQHSATHIIENLTYLDWEVLRNGVIDTVMGTFHV